MAGARWMASIEGRISIVRTESEKNRRNKMYCKYCRSRDIAPVKLVSRLGLRTRTALHCPNCGEELEVVWKKKKKEKKHAKV